ncbi:MAG: phosphotransferase [Rhodobacteraceae bacterium]|nr:phosphotransferase [Paracoccaceae bacterium]
MTGPAGEPAAAGERAAAAVAFLAAAGWGDARRTPLAGDASMRRYERLTRPDGSRAVLMDAPPGAGEDVAAFARIAGHLAAIGLSPPAILAGDIPGGFLLLEDLGDALFSRVVATAPEREAALYAAAADVLAEVQRHAAPPGLPRLDAATMPEQAAIAFDWYLAGATGRPAPSDARAAFVAALGEALERLAPVGPEPVLILRDYHAENLIWLPDRQGPARVGLLDFQLAHVGHPGYDLVSLVEDARRDVSAAAREAAIAAFVAATGRGRAALDAALAVLGAQRHLRILGVFARLALRDGKTRYLGLLPRVWGQLRGALSHPGLADLARATAPLPAPDPALLARLEASCGTLPAH